MLFTQVLSRLLLFTALLAPFTGYAANGNDAVPQIWQMLDYLATDYAIAVKDGEIIDAGEYTEMQEFSQTVHQHMASLSEEPGKSVLLDQAASLVQLVNAKGAPTLVHQQAHDLADQLLSVYPMPTSPEQMPNLAEGAQLYQTHCASCHGVTGNADGPAAKGLEPPVIAFTDAERADQRSPLSLYQTATQGVADTSMLPYADSLRASERWALAYYIGSMAYQDKIEAGSELWNNTLLARAQVRNLDELSRVRVDQLASVLGRDQAQALIGYLRENPAELEEALNDIALARGRLQASLRAYQQGDQKNAVQLALSAYLDGVEPIEPLLNARNRALRGQIELAMGVYRTGLGRGADIATLTAQVTAIDALLVEADTYTQSEFRNGATLFVASFTILLREGLEALLIVIAIFAFLIKANRKEALVYVHAGWIVALLAGVLTWVAARYFINISGASRELTEGVSALFAALMLLSVGLWMHQKSIGDRWYVYIQQKMSHAMSKRSAWLLFLLVFVSVYREVFETILFYAALWVEGQVHVLLAGIACAVLVLAMIAWFLLRSSRKMPLATFFSISSIVIAVLVVVLTGKGVSSLQEAGVIAVTAAPLPHFDWLGMFPTWETSIAQGIAMLLLVFGYIYNTRISKAA